MSSGISVVHNGIIENHEALREELRADNYPITSDTDSEVVAHLVHRYLNESSDLQQAVTKTIGRLEGAYALGVMSQDHPNLIIGARSGSPLVVGVGMDEHFIASDQMALRQVTDRFVYLEEGDIVAISSDTFSVFDSRGKKADRAVSYTHLTLPTTPYV